MFLKPPTTIFHRSHVTIISILLLLVLIYTRVNGISWGLPYPMHPDERNMTAAVLNMHCETLNSECLNPHFYAYGQLPLYIAYFTAHAFSKLSHNNISFETVTLILRLLSVLSSIGTALLLRNIIKLIYKPHVFVSLLNDLLIIFVPVFIQFSHFGTTESLLMFLYTSLLYLSIRLMANSISVKRFSIISGIVLGIAVGIKVSSLLFGFIPFISVLWYMWHLRKNFTVIHKVLILLRFSLMISCFTGAFYVLSSPYNILGFQEFIGSMKYESDVGLGNYRAFYTRQFEYTIPVLYQMVKSFPYALGGPMFIIFLFSFIFLPWNKVFLFLRLQFLLFFIPNAILYAKWTRFLAPLYPLMIVMIMCMINQLTLPLTVHHLSWKKHQLFWGAIVLTVFVSIVPGIAYLSIYNSPDVRFTASRWIYKNVKQYGPILSETANVVDIPFPVEKDGIYPYFNTISFNFYEMHQVPALKRELQNYTNESEYVFVPSRRVFANHTCLWPTSNTSMLFQNRFLQLSQGYSSDRCVHLQKNYPDVNSYYRRLFDSTHYVLLKEFTSYPRIEILGRTLLSFPDEQAEETWTVFDHPVVRIYRKI